MRIKASLFYVLSVLAILLLLLSNLGLVLLLLGQKVFWIVMYGIGVTGVLVLITVLNQRHNLQAEIGSEIENRRSLQNYFPFFVILFFHFVVLIVRWGTLKVPTDQFFPEILFGGQGLLLLSLFFLRKNRLSKIGDFFFRFALYALGYVGLAVSWMILAIASS